MIAPDDTGRRVRLDPPTLHAPRGDTVAAVSFGAGVAGWTLGTAVYSPLGVVAAIAGAAAGLGALAYPWQRRRLHDLRLRSRIRRAQRSAPSPIAAAREGLVHVRGRVHVLTHIPLLTIGERIAAYVVRQQVRTRCSCTDACSASYVAIRTEWAAGRFAIVDESGVAVIDGGVVDLWPAGTDLAIDGQLALRHGDVVDALGPAVPVDAPDVATLAPSTYRARATPVGLVGTVEQPVTIVFPVRD